MELINWHLWLEMKNLSDMSIKDLTYIRGLITAGQLYFESRTRQEMAELSKQRDNRFLLGIPLPTDQSKTQPVKPAVARPTSGGVSPALNPAPINTATSTNSPNTSASSSAMPPSQPESTGPGPSSPEHVMEDAPPVESPTPETSADSGLVPQLKSTSAPSLSSITNTFANQSLPSAQSHCHPFDISYLPTPQANATHVDMEVDFLGGFGGEGAFYRWPNETSTPSTRPRLNSSRMPSENRFQPYQPVPVRQLSEYLPSTALDSNFGHPFTDSIDFGSGSIGHDFSDIYQGLDGLNGFGSG